MKPNPNNGCAGAFKDWVEVMLTKECNGKCSWCVEKDGWTPSYQASYSQIAEAVWKSGAKNVVLLGGEPTLYPHIGVLITMIKSVAIKVYVTTNGSNMSFQDVAFKLIDADGVNISIHDHDLVKNFSITGINLTELGLKRSVSYFNDLGITVRFNCNLIKGHIDNGSKMREYASFAHEMGASEVRFSELITMNDDFVDMTKIGVAGSNDEPFSKGCNFSENIRGIKTSFKQMCGLLVPNHRTEPLNPECVSKKVIYFDGNIYDGWQIKPKGIKTMGEKELTDLLVAVKVGAMTPEEVAAIIRRAKMVDQPGVVISTCGGIGRSCGEISRSCGGDVIKDCRGTGRGC